jgi:hypothetical protein
LCERLQAENHRIKKILGDVCLELDRYREGLSRLKKQDFDRGYSPEDYAEAVLSGDEPCSVSEIPALWGVNDWRCDHRLAV